MVDFPYLPMTGAWHAPVDSGQREMRIEGQYAMADWTVNYSRNIALCFPKGKQKRRL